MTESKLLQVENVSVKFGGLAALTDVSFAVESDQVLGIIGPNGAGKTTLLNALSKVVRTQPNARVSLAGESLLGKRSHQIASMGIARTFQIPQLADEDSIFENLMVGAHLHRGRRARQAGSAGRSEFDLHGRALMELLGIEGWSNRLAGAAPYAVRKRVQIGRALLSRPRLMFLDEPASGLTPDEKAELAESIRAIRAEFGISMLIIEHDVDFLKDISDQFLALAWGRVLASGNVSEVIRHPQVIEAYLGEPVK